MPLANHLMLRAQRARLEARTTAMRVLLSCALLLLCNAGARAQDPDKQSFEMIEHGRYMAIAGDCAACHTAKGAQPFAGGGALETPFGILLAPNITPDLETGIGGWTNDEFVDAVRNGLGHGGIHLYPAMPYTYYTKMSRTDAIAIRAYLDTVQPVRNEVHANQLPFPFNQRETMIGWNELYFTPGEFKPDPGKSAEWNRGAYLVEGAEHCGLCHTPKNVMGGDENGQAMQGSVLQNWYAPNITGNRRVGIGDWTADDIALYLKTGRNRYDIASGAMADAVTHSTSHLTDADLRAIAVYLKDLPPGGGGPPQPVSAQDPAMQQGQAIYNNHVPPAIRREEKASSASSRASVEHRSCNSRAHEPHPCGAGRFARGRHRRGSDRPRDAVLRLAAVRRRRSRRRHLHSQCLGQCRTTGFRRRGQQYAADAPSASASAVAAGSRPMPPVVRLGIASSLRSSQRRTTYGVIASEAKQSR